MAKTNLQQLAKTLAQKKDRLRLSDAKKLSQKDAEAFLKEFFDSIIQNVTTDKIVKIKGLGTFKLIEVLDRESVNVNTGERFIIPGHSKLSFTPETALKDLINKPFADFQTVVLNEGTPIEEMEKVPEEAPDLPDPTSESEDETDAEETETSPVQTAFDNPELYQKETSEPTPAPEPTVSEETEGPEAEHEKEPEAVSDAPAAEKEESSKAKMPAWLFGIVLLCLLCFFAGHYLMPKPSAPVQETDEPKAEMSVEAPTEVASEEGEEEEAVGEETAEAPTPEEQYAQVPNGEYKIVGTRKTHVMQSGDYLTKIAIDEYGDKYMVKYIIVHNAFPNPDNVPIGAEIKLPELEKIK